MAVSFHEHELSTQCSWKCGYIFMGMYVYILRVCLPYANMATLLECINLFGSQSVDQKQGKIQEKQTL